MVALLHTVQNDLVQIPRHEEADQRKMWKTFAFFHLFVLIRGASVIKLFSQTDISRNYAKISRLNNYEAFIDLHSAGIDRDSNRESLQSIAIITRMIPVTTNCASSAFVLHVIFKK